MPQTEPRFQARESEQGWRVVWVFSDGEEEAVEGDKVYPHRQNAYRRAKQLNDVNGVPYILHVRMKAQHDDCIDIKRWISMNLGGYGVYVIDPLVDHDPELRTIQFSAQVRYRAEDRDPDLASYDEPVPVQDQFTEKLERLRVECPVRELEYSHQSYRPY